MTPMSAPPPPPLITIQKADAAGRIVTRYHGCLLADGDPLLVLARWRHDPLHLSFVSLLPGDIFIEQYERHQYYNLFAIYNGKDIPLSETLCALMEPKREGQRLEHDIAAIIAAVRQRYQAPCPLKGVYVNFTYPVQYDAERQILTWRDLALDIWLPAQGKPLLLDEDEYAALQLAEHEPETAAVIARAQAYLWRHAQQRSGPFASL